MYSSVNLKQVLDLFLIILKMLLIFLKKIFTGCSLILTIDILLICSFFIKHFTLALVVYLFLLFFCGRLLLLLNIKSGVLLNFIVSKLLALFLYFLLQNNEISASDKE